LSTPLPFPSLFHFPFSNFPLAIPLLSHSLSRHHSPLFSPTASAGASGGAIAAVLVGLDIPMETCISVTQSAFNACRAGSMLALPSTPLFFHPLPSSLSPLLPPLPSFLFTFPSSLSPRKASLPPTRVTRRVETLARDQDKEKGGRGRERKKERKKEREREREIVPCTAHSSYCSAFLQADLPGSGSVNFSAGSSRRYCQKMLTRGASILTSSAQQQRIEEMLPGRCSRELLQRQSTSPRVFLRGRIGERLVCFRSKKIWEG
jgi:hypothetical protein